MPGAERTRFCFAARIRNWNLRCSRISGATCRASLYKKYNEAKHIVTWQNGSTTRFGYCRNENDVYQYQGAEYLFIGAR